MITNKIYCIIRKCRSKCDLFFFYTSYNDGVNHKGGIIMKNDLTELVFILDKSGSMSGLEGDTIGGFNSLIEKQKCEDGEVVVTTVLFNEKMKYVHDRIDIKEVNKMTRKDYMANGCTALLDAVGNTIKHIVDKQKELKEEFIPEKTMVVITTDGLENSSVEYDYPDIRKLIEKQKELGWEFIFLGANIDVNREARRFGIDEDNAVEYKCDKRGVNLNYEALSGAVTEMRCCKTVSKDWHKEIDDYFKEIEEKEKKSK